MKKAQVQMMETIAVLFIFFILIAFGFIFYANVLKGSIAVTKREHSELKAIELANRVSSLPELQCSDNNIVQENCIDWLKLEKADLLMDQNRLFYFGMLGYSNVIIEQVFPVDYTSTFSYTVYSNIPPDYSDKLPTYIPILLKKPITGGYGFGIMTVILYAK